jgi:hypothetical protein
MPSLGANEEQLLLMCCTFSTRCSPCVLAKLHLGTTARLPIKVEADGRT